MEIKKILIGICCFFLLNCCLFSGLYGATWTFGDGYWTSLSNDPNVLMVHKGDIVNITFDPHTPTSSSDRYAAIQHSKLFKLHRIDEGNLYSKPIYFEAIDIGNKTMNQDNVYLAYSGPGFCYQIIVLPNE